MNKSNVVKLNIKNNKDQECSCVESLIKIIAEDLDFIALNIIEVKLKLDSSVEDVSKKIHDLSNGNLLLDLFDRNSNSYLFIFNEKMTFKQFKTVYLKMENIEGILGKRIMDIDYLLQVVERLAGGKKKLQKIWDSGINNIC